MKKSLRSFINVNRKPFLLLGIVLGIAGFGAIAWSVGAQDASKKSPWTTEEAASRAAITASRVAADGAAVNITDGGGVALDSPSAVFNANAGSLGLIPDCAGGCTNGGNYNVATNPGQLVTFDVTGMSAPLTEVGLSTTGVHSWVGDLRFTLISPGGTASQIVFSQTGATTATAFGSSSDFGGPYVFSDTAPASPTWWTAAATTPVPAGSYRASTPGGVAGGGANTTLTPAFAGLSAGQVNGQWTLRIQDGGLSDTGSTTAAALTLITGGATPTPTNTPTATPTPGPGCNWTQAAPIPVPYLDEAVTVIGTNLYQFGGVANGAIVANSNRFDGTTWTAIAPLPAALEFPTAVTDGTNAYILGGALVGTGTPQTTLYRYNVATNTYTTLAPFTTGTWNAAAVLLNGKIYKFAGTGPATASTNVHEIYDIATNSWSLGAVYPETISFVGAFVQGNFIYAGGGIASVGSIASQKTFRYNPATNTWDDAAIADMPQTRWGTAAAFFDGKGTFAGGYVAGTATANISTSVIAWDQGTNTWITLPNMLGERARMSGGVLGGNLYVVGGRSIASAAFLGTSENQRLACAAGTPTPTNTPTSTPTATPTSTPTNTPTATPTGTPSGTATPTATPTVTPTPPPGSCTTPNTVIYGYNLDNDNLVRFTAAAPGTYSSTVQLTGFNANEFLVGMDFRPATPGFIYAVTGVFGAGTPANRTVALNTFGGPIVPVGSVAQTADSFFGVDFNPVPDRIRIVGDADTSRRLNPNDGTLAGTDTPLAYVAGDPGFGVNPQVVHVAYTNSQSGATLTTLYGIDAGRDTLVRIGGPDGTPSPNTGQLTTIGPLGVDAASFGGFDIQPGTNIAFAALSTGPVGARISRLYSINLATGAATLIGDIGNGTNIIDGMTIAPCSTAAGVVVSGRVLTPDGRGLRNAVVSMTDASGVTRSVTTSTFGYYQFEEVSVGETFVMSVASRRYRFGPRAVQVIDSLSDVDFIGQE